MNVRMRALLILTAVATIVGIGWAWRQSAGAAASAAVREAGENTRHTTVNERIGGLDPVRTYGPGNGAFAIAQNIYEPLYQYHYLKRPFDIIPCLAAEMPEWDADGGGCTIVLREDVFFQDDPCFAGGKGRAMEAEDVIYSWKRLADPHNASPYWDLLRGRIKGLDAFRDKVKDFKREEVNYAAPVEGLKALDLHRLRITFERPWPQMLYALTALPTAVVPHEAVEQYGDEFPRHAAGTGPYGLESWRDGVELVLVRNPAFRDERYPSEGAPGDEAAGLLKDAGKRLPFIDRLHFKMVEVGQPTWLLLMQGAVDLHGVPGSNYSEIIGPEGLLTGEMKSRGLQLDISTSTFCRWIALNMKDPLIAKNKSLRQALSLAMDRKEFNDVVLNGRSRLPTGLIPDIYKEHISRGDHPLITFDLERARALKKDADALNGEPIRKLSMLMSGSSPLLRQIGQMFQQWLKKIDIELTLEIVDDAGFRKRAKEHPPQLIFGVGFGAQSPDISQLFLRFYGPNVESGLNPFHYENPSFDALFDKASVMPDGKDRVAAYHKLEEMVLEDGPCIVFLDYTWQTARFNWLENVKPLTFFGPTGLGKYERLNVKERTAYVQGQGR